MIFATIERATHLIGVYIEHSAGQLGITQGEAHVLVQLDMLGPTSIGTLHRDFGHKRSTLTSIIDRLEQRNFVLRELNPNDRRSFIVKLTPLGQKAATRVTKALEKLERAVLRMLTEGDVRGVEAVRAAIEIAIRQQRSSPANARGGHEGKELAEGMRYSSKPAASTRSA